MKKVGSNTKIGSSLAYSRMNWPIFIILGKYFLFVFLRYFFLKFYPQSSYLAKANRSPFSPLYMLDEALIIYTALMICFIFGYYLYFALSGSITANKSYYDLDKKTKTNGKLLRFFLVAFFFLAFLKMYQYVVLGYTITGESKFHYTNILILILPPMEIIFLFIWFVSKSKIIKFGCFITIIITGFFYGSKASILTPVMLIIFLNFFSGKSSLRKDFLKIVISFSFVLFILFPFIYVAVNDYRKTFSFNLEDTSAEVWNNYEKYFIDNVGYIYYRLSKIEPLQAMIQRYDLVNKRVTPTHFLVHVYNFYVPSFMESEDVSFSYFGNKLFPILFFGQGITERSSEDLSIPGVLVFYFGTFSPLAAVVFGIFLGVVYKFFAFRCNDPIFSAVISAFLLYYIYIIESSGSISHFVYGARYIVIFSFYYFIIKKVKIWQSIESEAK